jgi:hypothetical protein
MVPGSLRAALAGADTLIPRAALVGADTLIPRAALAGADTPVPRAELVGADTLIPRAALVGADTLIPRALCTQCIPQARAALQGKWDSTRPSTPPTLTLRAASTLAVAGAGARAMAQGGAHNGLHVRN